MGKKDVDVIQISPSTPPCAHKKVFGRGLASPEKSGRSETPIGHILCLKNADDVERFEETEDCFILDFDPVDLTKLLASAANDAKDAPEISVVYEKGQVACRDYPHSRHLCLKFPFETTLHECHCDMCYCYVCDLPAPCSKWTGPARAHCHASHEGDWKTMRSTKRQLNNGLRL